MAAPTPAPMPAPTLTEAITKPLSVVEGLFKQAGCPAKDKEDFGVREFFTKLVADPQGYEQVPYLTSANADLLPNNSLVRFRGVVQDMMTPEYYAGAAQRADGTWCTSKYNDGLPEGQVAEDDNSRMWERKPLYCATIPSLSPWAQPASTVNATASIVQDSGKAKRGRDDDSDMAVDTDAAMEHDQNKSELHSAAAAADGRGGSCCASKKACGVDERMKDQGGEAAAPAEDSFQAGDCIVYVYDKGAEGTDNMALHDMVYDEGAEGTDNVVLHDMVEVVGVLSKLPQLASMHMGVADDGDMDMGMKEHLANHPPTSQVPDTMDMDMDLKEHLANHPPTSKVLRLHAILIKKQPQLTVQPHPATTQLQASAPVAELRSQAIQLLTLALGGDSLAAEYLLMQLLARVSARTEGMPVGMVPMNLTHCPQPPSAHQAPPTTSNLSSMPPPPPKQPAPTKPDPNAPASPFVAALAAAVAALVPLSSVLPLTVGKCNSGPWAPKRDYETNRLSRSPLQLPPGTCLLVDETVMDEGTLSEIGVASFQTLSKLLQEQVLAYDFVFYEHPVPVNLPAVVFSTGRSLLNDALLLGLPLKATVSTMPSKSEIEKAVADAEAQGAMAPVRSFLVASASLAYNLSEEMYQYLQQEFLKIRKENPTFGADQFHNRLTLARMCAISFGEAGLSQERWQYMMALETTREARRVEKWEHKKC
eukprot:gene4636-14832_t